MKTILLYTLILCGALLATSCNDWLDVKPKAQVDQKNLFKKAKGFEDALTACYIKMNATTLYGRSLTMTTIEYLAQHWDHTSGNYRDEDKLKDFQYTTDFSLSAFSSIYGDLYNVIAQANTILENIVSNEGVFQNKDIRDLIEAEALGVRAFCHTDILRLFGQMPQNATTQVQLPYAKTVSTGMIPYYSFTDYINLILEDINAAQALFKESDPVMTYTFKELDEFTNNNSNVELSDIFMGYRRFRFNYYAMEALKARLYMYLGEKTKAYEAANNVIQAKSEKGDKMLTLAGVEDFSQKYYALPSECILALSNNEIKDAQELFAYDRLFLTSATFTELFSGQSTSVNNRALYVWKETTNSGGTRLRVIQKYNQPEEQENMNANINMTRYQVIPLLRLSEMYLIAIETAATITEANSLYSEYMNARGVIAPELTADELKTEIQKEYQREFYAEGQMFYTYKRLGLRKMPGKSDREVSEKDYIVPLPTTELGSN